MAKLMKNSNMLCNINVLYLSGNLVKFPGLNGDLTGYPNRQSRPRIPSFELILESIADLARHRAEGIEHREASETGGRARRGYDVR